MTIYLIYSQNIYFPILEQEEKIMDKAVNVRERNRTNHRLNRFLLTYHMFLNEKLLTDSDFSRLIFVDEYIQSLKFKLYDESSKEQLINDIEKFYPNFDEIINSSIK